MHEELIGKRVQNKKTRATGVIKKVAGEYMEVSYHGKSTRYRFPDAFSEGLTLEDEDEQEHYENAGEISSFAHFRNTYKKLLNKEISYLKTTGEKRHRLFDGHRISQKGHAYCYVFETDTDHHLVHGSDVRLYVPEHGVLFGNVLGCEDFSLMLNISENIGSSVESAEFSTESCFLLEALCERLDEMADNNHALAYDIACRGRQMVDLGKRIRQGQTEAFRRATSEPITFVWGPPGTGKTYTLAQVALDYMSRGFRVLMLSYSNVSVDGATLRIAGMKDTASGEVLRYGYPRMEKLQESKDLNSRLYVLQEFPYLAERYDTLVAEKKNLRRNDPKRAEVNKEIEKIRQSLREAETEALAKARLVATTVSKAVVDKAIFESRFDYVIFDEASMAYVPQIVFAAGLAQKGFLCLGDFCQLPAISQDPSGGRLAEDIFSYTGIAESVENGYGHKWLVMLNIQYRMHPDIAAFVSEKMYFGNLLTATEIKESRAELAGYAPFAEEAMTLVDLSGMYSVCIRISDGSHVNILSALISLRFAEMYLKHNLEIGIITPYSAQARLLMAMIRDRKKTDKQFEHVTCATVHQFQGSEKTIIIYDATDCFLQSRAGYLLTNTKGNQANRLFNVAMTRAEGKFILVANRQYFQKKLSRKLMFYAAMRTINNVSRAGGEELLAICRPSAEEIPKVYMDDSLELWERYIKDLEKAGKRILIDMPGMPEDEPEKIRRLGNALESVNRKGVKVILRKKEDLTLPKSLREFAEDYPYVTNPITVIDSSIIWYGQPLAAPDYTINGESFSVKYFPCVRFEGRYTAEQVQAYLQMKVP